MKLKKPIYMLLLTPNLVFASNVPETLNLKRSFAMILVFSGLILLLLTMQYLSRVLKLFGGKIGKSMNILAIGVFIIALKEILAFVNIFFDYNIVELFAKSEIAKLIFQSGTNFLVFAFFAYGFYGLSKIIEKK